MKFSLATILAIASATKAQELYVEDDSTDFGVTSGNYGLQNEMMYNWSEYQMPKSGFASSKLMVPEFDQFEPVTTQRVVMPLGSHSTSRLVLPAQLETATQFVNAPVHTQGVQSRFTLPLISKSKYSPSNAPLYAEPIYHEQISDQNVIRPHYVTQPVIRTVEMVQPIRENRYVEQPIVQPVITQPVLRKHFIDQPYLTNELITQPMVQPLKTHQSFVRTKLVQAPSVAQTQYQTIVEAPAKVIVSQRAGATNEAIVMPVRVVQAPEQILNEPLVKSKKAYYYYI